MQGIDISAWQGDNNINLAKVPFDFCIIKATEGTDYTNRYLDKHATAVQNKKKLLGVYHYANGGDYKAEADHFLTTVKKYIGKAIIVLDWESRNNPQFGVNDLAWCAKWCSYVKEKTGVRPVIYIQKSAKDAVRKAGYRLWVAQYADNNPTGYQLHPWNEGAYTCTMRQYTSHGRLAGYDGELDLNKCYLNSGAWRHLAGRAKTATTSAKKSVDAIAREVLAGKWGNGDDRKNRLKAASYDYDKVQARVNKLVNASQLNEDKIINAVAHEVISGKYGNEPERSEKLRKAGYNPSAVQKRVNELLGV